MRGVVGGGDVPPGSQFAGQVMFDENTDLAAKLGAPAVDVEVIQAASRSSRQPGFRCRRSSGGRNRGTVRDPPLRRSRQPCGRHPHGRRLVSATSRHRAIIRDRIGYGRSRCAEGPLAVADRHVLERNTGIRVEATAHDHRRPSLCINCGSCARACARGNLTGLDCMRRMSASARGATCSR